jgi:3'-phosphoadenosine 5'-phosphosulfate sulfotransferase (PAPS reductase)/FAD synthetase
MIDVPKEIRDGSLLCIVSVSGGKDSTACALALREADVPFRMVFADTGWEAKETYEHLDHLRAKIGPIDVVGVEGGMVAKIRHRAGFPARMQRWCTRELKLQPLREYHDAQEADRETVSVVGIRAAESEARSKFLPWEDDEMWGGWMWRPILTWSIEDVLAIHHRHGVDVNPLYKYGHDRVGCYPCIYANKEEVRLVAEYAPERIAVIRDLERECEALRVERNAVTPGRYGHAVASYFQTRAPNAGPMHIDDVVAWSKTTHGGRQLPLLGPAPDGGCFRWGMCEPPTTEKVA